MGRIVQHFGIDASNKGNRKHNSSNEAAESLPFGEFVQYWCTVAVSEELHFTRAAQQLHMDQSAVSRHIQKLEARLGARLFVRSGRGVELTDAGKGFLPYARKSLALASQGERLAQAIDHGDPLEFEVAYSPLVDVSLIQQIRQLARNASSALPLRFQSIAPDNLTERLLNGASQVAIGILPAEGDLAKVCILREKLFAALPASHRLAHRRAVHASELACDPVIWLFGAHDSMLSNHFGDLFQRAGYVPHVTWEAQSVTEAFGLVREGFGVSFVKASELRFHPDGIVLRPLLEPHLVVDTGLLYVPELRWKILAEFVSLVSQHLRCDESGPAETRGQA
jgi:DNA-binding transcriptional LysR family regulator